MPDRAGKSPNSPPGNVRFARSPEGGRALPPESSTPEVLVHGIGAGGVGVGTLPDGKVVFLPRTAPGDRVTVRLTREKPRWARGEVLEWIEEGDGRRTPPCSLFGSCDGCTLQHLTYEAQLEIKGSLAGEALRRIGALTVENPRVEPSPRELRYRNKLTFTLRRLRGGRVVAGFRELGRPGRILNIQSECLLPNEELGEAWVELRRSWGPGASLLPKGGELRLTLRRGERGAALLVRGGTGDGKPEELLGKVPGLGSIWKETREGGIRSLAGDPSLQVPWLDESLELPGGGFLQVNREVGEAIHTWIRERIGGVEGRRVVDAYCGVASLGRALARDGAEVVGIEMDRAGIAVAESFSCPGFRIVEGLVEDHLGPALPSDVLVLNPPRTGLAATIPEIMKSRQAGRVVYVSCDPATLARDLARLGESYELEEIHGFDLFPQTGHVETVALLTGKDV